MITFWLYFNNEPIYAVRAPEDSDNNYVRFLARDWHLRVPLCHPVLPSEFERMIAHSEVRIYESN